MKNLEVQRRIEEIAGSGKHSRWRRFMTMKVRALLVGIVLLAEMWLVGCGHYNCGTTFGASSCSGGNGGFNQGGGGTTKGTYLLIADAGGIQGEVLDPTAGTFALTPGFGTVDISTFTKVPGDWMVIAGGKYMYSAYGAIGQIFGWSVNGNGTLTSLTTLSSGDHQPALYLLNMTAGFNAGQQFMIANPAGTLLFVADSMSDQVHVYQIGTTGSLTEVLPAIQLPLGFNPYNLAVDGQGKYLYVSNLVGLVTTEVAGFSINGSTLAALQNSPFQLALQQMQGEASGKFMVGTRADTADRNIYAMSIDQSGGLTQVGLAATADVPGFVAVQPNAGGHLAYSFGLGATIEGVTLDLNSGNLVTLATPPLGGPGVFGQFDPSGKYLFVEEDFDNPTVLDAYDVSADSTLSSALASVGWSPGAWQAFDTQ